MNTVSPLSQIAASGCRGLLAAVRQRLRGRPRRTGAICTCRAAKAHRHSAPAAKSLSGSATAVLVFPKIIKAGLGDGGRYSDGVLFKGGKVADTATN
jgi:lipid-binding SYLF domain-containing protein